jgi:hypothetical protein
MGKLVKQGPKDIGVDEGTTAKDSFDMPETLPQVSGLEAGANEALQNKEMSKNVLPEAKSAVNDLPPDWVEKKVGTVMPQTGGNPATPLEDPDLERFAKEAPVDYQGTKDGLEGEDILKKAVGHKTTSGL